MELCLCSRRFFQQVTGVWIVHILIVKCHAVYGFMFTCLHMFTENSTLEGKHSKNCKY